MLESITPLSIEYFHTSDGLFWVWTYIVISMIFYIIREAAYMEYEVPRDIFWANSIIARWLVVYYILGLLKLFFI